MKIKRLIVKTISLLANNPSLFFKLLRGRFFYKVLNRWFLPKSPVQKRIKGVLFEFDFSLGPNIKQMYFGCYEIETIEVMKIILKRSDVFIDVGANIGYLSAIGAAFVGKSGQVHSFEPVPQYFQKLKKMTLINPDCRIIANQLALGEREGIANIDVTNTQSFGWNTMAPDLMIKEMIKETLEVPVYRLDSYIEQKALTNISLIKIDVEGFEFPVLRGLSNYFENIKHRTAIICEIHPSAYPLVGYTIVDLVQYMKKYKYSAYRYFYYRFGVVDITKFVENTIVVFISAA